MAPSPAPSQSGSGGSIDFHREVKFRKKRGKRQTEKALMRQMMWIKTAGREGWGCSQCAWTIRPPDPLRGSSLDEMKQNYLNQREREFASHICAAHPRAKSARDDSGFPRRFGDRTNCASPSRRGERNDMR
jgi:hypothetical protein